MSSQVACLYFHLFYTSFSYLTFAKNILFIHAGVLAYLPGLLLFEIDHSSLKGVTLQYQCLLGAISPPGPYVKRSKTTLLLTHYMIPKPGYMQVGLTVVSHFGSSRLIQPALKPESRISTFLPSKEGPDTP